MATCCTWSLEQRVLASDLCLLIRHRWSRLLDYIRSWQYLTRPNLSPVHVAAWNLPWKSLLARQLRRWCASASALREAGRADEDSLKTFKHSCELRCLSMSRLIMLALTFCTGHNTQNVCNTKMLYRYYDMMYNICIWYIIYTCHRASNICLTSSHVGPFHCARPGFVWPRGPRVPLRHLRSESSNLALGPTTGRHGNRRYFWSNYS
jgi:hypothetical protein